MLQELTAPLLIVLFAGVISGIISKRFNISLVIGYLLAGACIGLGGLNLVNVHQHEMEQLAEAGALFLLFSIGIEFSLDEMLSRGKDFLQSGLIQITAVIFPVTLFLIYYANIPWNVALLLASAIMLSSTVLVFRSLTEMGHVETPHGKRALGILLFQDIALVPLLLFIPLLTGSAGSFSLITLLSLIGKSLLFLLTMAFIYKALHTKLLPLLAALRSVELILLMVLCLLGAICWWADFLGLPVTIGALATGLIFSGNRLSHQIDSILLPFRETFAAIFFVSLGMLLEPKLLFAEPITIIGGMFILLTVKTLAGGFALKSIGLNWVAAFSMGLGISQLGEFSFMIAAQGLNDKVITQETFNKILLMALGSLILTPFLLKFGLNNIHSSLDEAEALDQNKLHGLGQLPHAIIIGMGPIGRLLATRLETLGVEVSLVDLSPVNLQIFAQAGFHTVSGDAAELSTLNYAGAAHCQLAVVSVPDDISAIEVVKSFRKINQQTNIVVRCRYQSNVSPLKKAGATQVISEEVEASSSILNWCEKIVAKT